MKKNMSQDKEFPSISIIIITKNVQRTLPRVLTSISSQDYPKRKIEILVVDGNSTDHTLDILRSSILPIRVIKSPYPDDPEACRGVAVLKAKNEILGFIDADNYIPHKNWLKKMLKPLIKHKEIYGVQTLRYGYRETDTALNRYFALLGSCDPVGFYLKKDDRLSFIYDKWNLYGKILQYYGDYFTIQFSPDYFPTLGCNGFFFRKSILFKIKVKPQNFFHIDTPLDLAKKGFNKYAIVNDEILHDTAGSFISFLKKRARYMKLHYQIRSSKRRYKVFDPNKKEDLINLIKFIIFSITFIEPLIFAFRGYLKKRDLVWFIHPIFSFSIMITYSFMVILAFFQTQYYRNKNKSI